ncbi:unnamed protein product, partial [marine sediment metagenome]
MRLTNVILAIILWLFIPISFLIVLLFELFVYFGSGSEIENLCGLFILPIILFILGFIVLYLGKDKV